MPFVRQSRVFPAVVLSFLHPEQRLGLPGTPGSHGDRAPRARARSVNTGCFGA